MATKTTESENRMASFFSRLNFSAKDRYLLTVNIRRDGSSKFGADTKWGWFPSASLGWKINKEEFLKDATWLDLLKLRLSSSRVLHKQVLHFCFQASLK